MKPSLLVFALVLSAGLGACGGAPDAPGSKAPAAALASDPKQVGKQLDQIYADFWEAWLQLNPIQATFIGDTRYNDQLPNFFSAEFRQRAYAFHRHWLDQVQAIDTSRLEGQARISYEVFVRERQMALDAERFPEWMLPINQFSSVASLLPMFGSGKGPQPFRSVADYDHWRQRAAAIPALFDTAIANMREGVKAGVVQPKVLMEKVLPQLDALTAGKPEESVFFGPIKAMPAGFAATDQARLRAEYRELIEQQLVPAYRRLRDYIANEYLAACRTTVSLQALPDGAAWYAFNVRSQTTTELSPQEIHQIGLDEVARIQGAMRQLMAEVEFRGELKDFFRFMTTDKRFEFASEAALLEAYNALRGRIDARIPELFSLLPKAAFEIRPVEPYRAQAMAGGQYFPPSADGTRPGIFYVNTFDLPTRKTWDMEDLYLHEAIPGHHFQLAIQQELENVPAFRRFGGETAFAEGWGLYAESLGRELGVYTDPYQYFGRLQGELWRAIRLVVDTGLHSQGWTREQVIAYMHDNSAVTDVDAIAEAERYIAVPGQALAYKIGELKLQELRQRAEKHLGERFDIRGFHAEVLRDGALPLDVLEMKIDRWIAAQQ